MSRWRVAAVALVVVVALCGTLAWWFNLRAQPDNRVNIAYPEGVAAVVPLGFSAGDAPKLNVSTANPLQDDPNAVQEGKKLFAQVNCAGCHGYNAKGNMGPDLTDKAWRYGGTPIEVYKSIYEGRPQGMPAWGNSFPPQTIWQIVAYIQSLGGTFAPAPQGSDQQVVAGQATGANAGQKQ